MARNSQFYYDHIVKRKCLGSWTILSQTLAKDYSWCIPLKFIIKKKKKGFVEPSRQSNLFVEPRKQGFTLKRETETVN